ncbi:PSD1 and planctomycete cytochrome C domain-containing protein [Bremerella volcania]|uniref:PSD1 and planctomycete cytochrome C domain-containing protein n=1 Tax=Bremerella volcania TaxID=2527984 RepID=UPI0011AAD50C|nr:PSD1 and planctomycete cytochrome C domain-containing protein [Bremerella volcania]
MIRSSLAACLSITAMTLGVVAAELDTPQFDDAQLEFFEKEIRPILAKRCYECHGPDSETPGGGLFLTSRGALLAGGDSGASIVVGKPDESLLIEAIHYDGIYQMPPKSRMPEDEIAKLEQWVASGAAWPVSDEKNTPQKEVFDLEKRKAEHWAWRPVTRPQLPAVKNEAWVKDPVDRFILAKLEDAGLAPNGPAEPALLIRRLSFDLTGLPPKPEEVEAFVADPSPAAIEKVVDQLLASPRFGEHWGRHWLDLVRYAESRGHEFDYDIPNAYQYRDYVIRALNQDLPYNELVVEHIAGDLLERPRTNAETGSNESVLGTGFWHLGDWVHSPVDIRKDETDRFDNMLDVMNKAFLGLTVTCARCHDHKFDAISQADYYAQMGFLQSSSYRQVRFETAEHNQRIADSLDKLKDEFQNKAKAAYQSGIDRVSGRWEKELLTPGSPWNLVLAEAAKDAKHPLHYWAKSFSVTDEQRPLLLEEVHKLAEQQRLSIADYPGHVIHDYENLPKTQWRTDGVVFGNGPEKPGAFLWNSSNEPDVIGVRTDGAAVYDTRWSGLKLKPGVQDDFGKTRGWNRAGRTLKTDTFTLKDGRVHYLVKGSGYAFAVIDSHRMVQGPLHGKSGNRWESKDASQVQWIRHDLRDYLGHSIHLEFTPMDDQPLEVLLVVDGEQMPPRAKDAAKAALAFDQAASSGDVNAQRFLQTLKGAIDTPDGASLANWLVRNWDKLMPGEPNPFKDLAKQYRDQSQALLADVRWESCTAPGMWDNSAEKESLLIRGNTKTPAGLVERQLLTAITGTDNSFDPHGSGRLQLAHQMMNADNPFASRVAVNRVWHYLMGRGIVRSVDNFGVLGELPTHPQLLDYLAAEFVEDGWSLKRMIRRVVLSQTYQMSSTQAGSAEQADPKNDLFHRAEVKRLSGEAIRDSLLMVSGRLDEKMYGPSVPVYLTSFMQGRGRPGQSGPVDGAGRRSVYLEVRRNFLAPMMLAFDTPQPITTIGRRNQSNVPAQSLILLNDPFVIQQCEIWAKQAITQTPDDTQLRIERMVEQAFSRKPTAEELTLAKQFLESHGQTLSIAPQQMASSVELWRDLAHVLVNAKPFIFVR